MLKKSVCLECHKKWYGLKGEENQSGVKCYPPLDANEEDEIIRRFDDDWEKGLVWCLGCSYLSRETHPVTNDGNYSAFIQVEGAIPGFCLFKSQHMTERGKEKLERDLRQRENEENCNARKTV